MTTGGIPALLRTVCALAWLCVGLAACQSGNHSDPMQQPLAAASEEQVLDSLLQMKQRLPEADYQQLLQAVATLRTFDLEALSVEQHLATLDGKTPLQIIAAANDLARRQSAAISQ